MTVYARGVTLASGQFSRSPTNAPTTVLKLSEKNFLGNPKDILLPAKCALQWEMNRRRSDSETPTLIIPRLTWTPDLHQRMVFQPSNLLAAMWIRFAQTITGEFGLEQCAVCSKYFQVGPGGKRQDTATCRSPADNRRAERRNSFLRFLRSSAWFRVSADVFRIDGNRFCWCSGSPCGSTRRLHSAHRAKSCGDRRRNAVAKPKLARTSAREQRGRY